jgi:hypothetical protein
MHRKSDKTTAIALTLLFFGLTGVGWIIALIWALRLPNPHSNEVLQSRDALAERAKESLAARTQETKTDKESASRVPESSQVLTTWKLHH